MTEIIKFQIGKNGITEGVIQSLELSLKNHKQIRISMLRSSGRDRNNIVEMAEKIKSSLKSPCDYKIMGFTIILMRRGKLVR